jgi:uncharacterized protein with GYD domain
LILASFSSHPLPRGVPSAGVRREPHTTKELRSCRNTYSRSGYTLDGVRGVVAKGGSARKAAAKAAAKSVGGKLDVFYFAFGGTDVFTIADLPDNAALNAGTSKPCSRCLGGSRTRTVG